MSLGDVPAVRFWSKVDKTAPGGCWLWTGATANGYGNFYLDRRTCNSHRVAYEWLVGPVPDGLELDHLCRVKSCVNPAHLEPVTHQENTRRGFAVRTSCPQGHPYDDVNTGLHRRASGAVSRFCLKCHRESDRRRHAVRRARRELG